MDSQISTQFNAVIDGINALKATVIPAHGTPPPPGYEQAEPKLNGAMETLRKAITDRTDALKEGLRSTAESLGEVVNNSELKLPSSMATPTEDPGQQSIQLGAGLENNRLLKKLPTVLQPIIDILKRLAA